MFSKILLFCLLLLSGMAWAQRPILLITSFEPFDAKKGETTKTINASSLVGEALKIQYSQNPSSPIQVEHVVLPVSFQRVMPELESFIQKLPQAPTWIVSLGEVPVTPGSSVSDSIRIETRGLNRIGTANYDNDNFKSKSNLIIPDAIDASGKKIEAIKAIGFNVNSIDAYCSMAKKERKDVVLSLNAGSFVCNFLAFQIMSAIEQNNWQTKFQFIHVPSIANTKKINENVAHSTYLVSNYLDFLLAQPLTFFSMPVDRKEAVAQFNQVVPEDQRSKFSLFGSNKVKKSEKDLCIEEIYMNMYR